MGLRQPQLRMMTSVRTTSTAAAAAAQTKRAGRRPFGFEPSVRPQAGQVAASPVRATPQSPQRMSTAGAAACGQRAEVVWAAGHLSNQLRM